MVDRVRPLVLEQPATGGSQLDMTPTEVDPTQDGVDARAFFAQNGTSADSTAYMSRSGGNLTLTDASAGTKNAQDLVSRVQGAVAYHAGLIDLIHYLDEGPADAYASGCVLKVVRNGPLLTSRTWYTSASQSAPAIVSVAYTYKTGTPLPATKTWVVYTVTGTVARTLVDTFTWTGPLLSQVVRTWS